MSSQTPAVPENSIAHRKPITTTTSHRTSDQTTSAAFFNMWSRSSNQRNATFSALSTFGGIAIVLFALMIAAPVEPRSVTAADETASPLVETIRVQLVARQNNYQFVPLAAAVQLECPFENPHWSRNSEDITTPKSRRTKMIRIGRTKVIDYGTYVCRSTDSQSANVTLLDSQQREEGSAQPVEDYDVFYNGSSEPEVMSQNGVDDEVDDDDVDDYDEDEPPLEKPQLIELPTRNHLRAIGEGVRLRCPVNGNPTPNITWTKDGEALRRPVETKHWTLIVQDLTPKDTGNYTCLLCNAFGCVNFTTQLRIKGSAAAADGEEDYSEGTQLNTTEDSDSAKNDSNKTSAADNIEGPPRFVKFENFNRLSAKPSGNMVRLKCPAVGNPKPNITWTKNDRPISRSMGTVKSQKFAIVLEDLVPKDSGNYTCNVCNGHGCINYTIKLDVNDRVNHAALITKPPLNATVSLGGSITFPCAVLSDLHRHVQWVYQREDNNASKRERLKTDIDNPEVLQLFNVTYADEGWYTCIASNSLGHSAAKAYLRVTDKDPVLLAKIAPDTLFPIVGVTAFASLLLIMTIAMIVQFRKYKHEKLMKHRAMETVHQWTKKIIIVKPSVDTVNPEIMQIPIVKIEKQRTTLVQQPSSCDPNAFNEYEFPLDSNWEFSRHQLSMGQTLGEGAFGRVVMAEAHGLGHGGSNLIVAVKMVKEGHTDTDMASLVREMEVMKMIGTHINIINLLGCCSQDGPLYVIVEYAPNGNLKDFLKKHRPMSEFEVGMCHEPDRKEVLQKELISIAFQVARGMEYLASRKCIHRDLAARNVLVSEDFVVKIADFGLARDIQESEYYRKNTNGRLPIKWMAPESLCEKVYDTQSDVWSFGVLLWEIMTYGDQPYPQIFSSEHLYEFLREGLRMEKPARCSLNIYVIMRQCWNWHKKERPNFTEIVESLDQILGTSIKDEYLDVGIPRLETPPSSDDENDDEYCGSDAETLHEQSLLRYHHHR